MPFQQPADNDTPEPATESTPEFTPVTTPALQPEPRQKPTPKPVPAEQPKQPAVPAATPASPTVPPRKELIKTADQPIYYIQVGAFKRPPSPRFMKKLKEGGFTFITKSYKGIRRVRVGPYDSYSEAKAALPTIKAKLGINGLIVKY